MKKFVSILLLTTVVSTSVFAVPFNAALLNTMNAATEAQNDFEDFDVEGTELTEAEMSEAEGEGFFGCLLGGLVGAALNSFANMFNKNNNKVLTDINGGLSAGIGAFVAVIIPF